MNPVLVPSRRGFLKSSAVLGSGLIVGFSVPGAKRLMAQTTDSEFAPNAFLRIAPDDSITILLAHSEMGQGVWTTLTMLIAEELDADWSRLKVEHAPAAAAYASPQRGVQATVGSSSIREEFERYRRAGAMARTLLIQAAAIRLGQAPSALRTENGVVITGNTRLRYGELAEQAALLPAPDPGTLTLKEPGAWTLIGKGALRLDSPEKISGRAQYGIDVQLDGLLCAVVARAPMLGGTVRAFDATQARALPGVRNVVQVPSGIAVIADHYWAAKRGCDVLQVEWEAASGAVILDSDRQREDFVKLTHTPGLVATQNGDVEKAREAAHKVVEMQYFVPYLAHAAMEPLNCTVRLTADSCDIWVGSQMQTFNQRTAAKITGLAPEQIRIHTTFLGGGFGRRAVQDFVAEAVQVAKAAGVPVKTLWSRESDMQGGYYRAAFAQRLRVGLGRDGRPLSWSQTSAGQSIFPDAEGIHPTSIEGMSDSPYIKHTPAYRVEAHSPRSNVPVWYWRSVGHSHNAFVMESAVDELAHAAGQDPLAYRRLLLKAEPRHLGVLNLAAERFGWGRKAAAGRGQGIAVHQSFGSFCAQAVEISIEHDEIRVHRVVCAIDCGIPVNPDNIKAQMEGAIVFGLSAALFGQISIKEGRVQQSNFHDYRVLRMNEMPQIEVHVLPSTEGPGGVGEPATPPVAPAVANALFALTGQRLRELPLRLSNRA
ncbi:MULTISPECIES: xanthine dehydrogenase family protein molybdopterin-binding subunit [unclassified Pseudomonas]|uniref:xanthine dehydrogenase family protein molybdopterin-binding subunit n=1 Tax=unclassified Pseudomonas TaxID=196821 RepID=UPI0008714260|nr:MULTISPECIES: xanthine dehydrogenase family protein molybdopterin-binding subunit [unclassified Pseudomonas]SCW35605.1 isoquinoline 1-oxidoreductase, beta subunit [Pseudomonas sp. NFACC56-3]SFK16328.1 isoquinoline 1-oxidoreductase, beta subunit [Pseudomonas sp. NFACC52]